MQMKPNRRHAFSYVYLGGAVVSLIVSWFWPSTAGVGGGLDMAAERAKALLDLITTSMDKASALNAGVFALAGALAFKGAEWSSHWTWFDGLLLVLALFCGAASYQGVFIAEAALQEMVNVGLVDVFAPRLRLGLTIQYYGTLIGIFLLGWVFVRMLEFRTVAQR